MEEQEKEHSATPQQQSTNQYSTAEVQKKISEAIHSCIKENLQDPIKLEELGNSISKELDKINEPEKSCADEDGLHDITSSCVFNKATRKNLCTQRPAIPIIENSTSRRLKIIQSWLLNTYEQFLSFFSLVLTLFYSVLFSFCSISFSFY